MASEGQLPDIRSRIILDDSQVAEVFAKVGKQAEGMGQQIGDSAAVGRLATWGLGEQVETLGQQFGIPHKMGRQAARPGVRIMSRRSLPKITRGRHDPWTSCIQKMETRSCRLLTRGYYRKLL